jgi:hypothetical protein
VPGSRNDARPLRPLTTTSRLDPDSEESFTFAVMAETRPTLPGMPFPKITLDIMRELALLRPAFVFCAGDLIWGFQDTRQEMLNELDRVRALADTIGVPLFNVPGNHEVQSRPTAVELLREWGHDLYGSFDIGPWHFVGLNTEEVNSEGRVTGEQLEWLERDLEAQSGKQGTFVFLHRPLFSWFQGDFNEDDRELLTRLFARHGVKAVFSAHDHFYYEEAHDGVRYVTVGGGGAPLYAQPPAGGFAHYVLVTVGREGVDLNVVEPNRLEVAYIGGNDGLEPVALARVANTTDRDLLVRNLEFRVPRLSTRELYRVESSFRDFAREAHDLPAAIRDVIDMGDGSVTVSVQLEVPTGTSVRVSVEAREQPETP